MSDLHAWATCRVHSDNGNSAFVSNSGRFLSIVELAGPVYQIDTREAYGALDSFVVASESSAVIPVVERVSPTRIVVRLFADDGTLVLSDFAVAWYRVFSG